MVLTYVAYCFTEVQGYSKFGSMSVMEMQMEHLSIQDSNQEQFCTKKELVLLEAGFGTIVEWDKVLAVVLLVVQI